MRFERPNESHLPQLWRIWGESFDDPDELIADFARTAFSPNRARIALENDVPVAALYWFDCTWNGERLAYLYAIATDKNFRGRGICSRLMEDTHRHFKALGYAGALLVPSEESLFSFYRRMGYETACTVEVVNCTAEAGDLALTKIDKDEYAALRRAYLPKGGVIQEGETLDFLETWASFWKGEGFLLAAYPQNDRLIGAELLGNVTLAPQIVHALGYEKGSFQTVGEGHPFAMYLSLKEVPAPSYLGLALD